MKLTSKMLKKMISEEIEGLKELDVPAPNAMDSAQSSEESGSSVVMRKWMLNLSKDSAEWRGIDSTEAGLLQQLFGGLISASAKGASTPLLNKLIGFLDKPEAPQGEL